MKRLTLAPSSHTIPPSTIAGKSPSVVSTTYETVSLIPFGAFNSVPSMGGDCDDDGRDYAVHLTHESRVRSILVRLIVEDVEKQN